MVNGLSIAGYGLMIGGAAAGAFAFAGKLNPTGLPDSMLMVGGAGAAALGAGLAAISGSKTL